MKNLTSLLNQVSDEATKKLITLQQKFGVESKHSSKKVLLIVGENSMVNLEGGRYLTEIDAINEVLIDNLGYEYGFDCIDFEDFCQIIDNQEFQHNPDSPKTPITRELMESYDFKQTPTTPDHDDRGIEFQTKWACLSGLYICNNEPCDMEMVEGDFYTDEGEEHYICIESKEELDALEACKDEEEVLALIEKWEEKFI